MSGGVLGVIFWAIPEGILWGIPEAILTKATAQECSFKLLYRQNVGKVVKNIVEIIQNSIVFQFLNNLGKRIKTLLVRELILISAYSNEDLYSAAQMALWPVICFNLSTTRRYRQLRQSVQYFSLGSKKFIKLLCFCYSYLPRQCCY